MMAYEGHRAMFEAFGEQVHVDGRRPVDAQQRLAGYHLASLRLVPAAGRVYFGAKKANEPLHVQYSYDDRSIVVVNSFYKPFAGMRVRAAVYNLDMTEKFSREMTAGIPEDSSTRVMTLPEIADLSATYFVSLVLSDEAGNIVSRNFYWLSTKPETLEWEKSTWYHTPTKTFADYTALQSLPPVELKVNSSSRTQGMDRVTTVFVENPSAHLAFGVRLKLTKGDDGDEVLPVLWQDNYFALLPGERREITATYRSRDLGRATPMRVKAEAWN